MTEITREDKTLITRKLFECLKCTRAGAEIEGLTYEGESKLLGEEYVVIHYNNGYIRRVNVHMDSGTALISDVMSQI